MDISGDKESEGDQLCHHLFVNPGDSVYRYHAVPVPPASGGAQEWGSNPDGRCWRLIYG